MATKQVGAALTIVGGVFYVLGSLFVGFLAASLVFGLSGLATPPQPPYVPNPNYGTIVLAILAFGALTGVLIIVGGALLLSDSPGRRKTGGALAISMMVIGAIPSVGGLGIGFILTLIGAVLGLTFKERSRGTAPVAPSVPIQPLAGRSFCPSCGSELQQGAAFCNSCGSPATRQ